MPEKDLFEMLIRVLQDLEEEASWEAIGYDNILMFGWRDEAETKADHYRVLRRKVIKEYRHRMRQCKS